MKEILVMTPKDALPGFALAGVRQITAKPGHIWDELEKLCADPAIGVLIVDARLMEEIDPVLLKELLSNWAGVLVTLPAPSGRGEPIEDELQRLVKRALGYHVRLNP